jgi:hypothetical protein
MNGNGLLTRSYRKGVKIAWLIPFALAMLLISATVLSGCGDNAVPLSLDQEEAPSSYIPGLTLDQSKAVEQYGYPDHFFLSIDPVLSDRIERWSYFSEGKALNFDNGRLFGEEPIEDESAKYPPCGLHPQDFTVSLTPVEASQILGKPLYTQDVKDSLMPENTVLVFAKAILLYKSGQLIGVDTQVIPPQLPLP